MNKISIFFRLVAVVILCCMMMVQTVSAQADVSVAPSKRLAVGVEIFSTTGFGIELATNVLHPKIALRGGFSFIPTITFEETLSDFGLDQSMNTELEKAFQLGVPGGPTVSKILSDNKLPSTVAAVKKDTEVDVTASFGMFNGKILVDFYPFESSFRITGGFYIGKNSLVNVEGSMKGANNILKMLETVRDETAKTVPYGGTKIDYVDQKLIDGYNLTVKDVTKPIDAKLEINSFKPYIGLGFGRSVPNRFFGVSFDIGALFWGSPAITSSNTRVQELIDGELKDVTDVLKNFGVYPVLSLKLNFGVW